MNSTHILENYKRKQTDFQKEYNVSLSSYHCFFFLTEKARKRNCNNYSTIL